MTQIKQDALDAAAEIYAAKIQSVTWVRFPEDSNGVKDVAHDAFLSGAQFERERAKGLVEALRKAISWWPEFGEVETLKEALAQYEGGE
jgi:hypothetical protein